jgi:hypothetical protein
VADFSRLEQDIRSSAKVITKMALGANAFRRPNEKRLVSHISALVREGRWIKEGMSSPLSGHGTRGQAETGRPSLFVIAMWRAKETESGA